MMDLISWGIGTATFLEFTFMTIPKLLLLCDLVLMFSVHGIISMRILDEQLLDNALEDDFAMSLKATGDNGGSLG